MDPDEASDKQPPHLAVRCLKKISFQILSSAFLTVIYNAHGVAGKFAVWSDDFILCSKKL